MIDSGDLAREVATRGGAHLVFGASGQPIAAPGDTVVEGGDRTRRNVADRDPPDGKVEVARDPATYRGSPHGIEAGRVQRAPYDGARTVNGAGVAGEHVLARSGPLVDFSEGRELRDRVRVVRGVVQNRRLLARSGMAEIEERARAESNDASHAESLTGVQDVRRADHVHGLEVGEVLTGAAEQSRCVDRRFASCGRSEHISGARDAAADQRDTDGVQCRRLFGVAHQSPDLVAALYELLAYVRPGEPCSS